MQPEDTGQRIHELIFSFSVLSIFVFKFFFNFHPSGKASNLRRTDASKSAMYRVVLYPIVHFLYVKSMSLCYPWLVPIVSMPDLAIIATNPNPSSPSILPSKTTPTHTQAQTWVSSKKQKTKKPKKKLSPEYFQNLGLSPNSEFPFLFVNYRKLLQFFTASKIAPKTLSKTIQIQSKIIPTYNHTNPLGFFIKSIPSRTTNHSPQPALIFYLRIFQTFSLFALLEENPNWPCSPPPQSIRKP